ncbi:MAG: Flp pilus assembly complex ATPase component TadA [Candidatus Moraniibacteriota bacterium]|nr:MAG: Flp pilus assembly complex ATPase component TadA [Candidatus Moranbacteria bacterium]
MKIENKKLRDFLLDTNFIKKDIIENAFLEAESKNENLSTILLEQKAIEEADLQKFIAYILGIPFVDLEKMIINSDVLRIIPEPIAKKYTIVAFEKNGKELKIAMLHPEDLQTIDFISKKSGLKIVPCFSTKKSILSALRQYEKSLQAEFINLIDEDTGKIHEEENSDSDLEKVAQDIPVIRIVDTLLKYAIIQQASDIHIEPTEKEVIVRYRIDGMLHDAMNLSAKVLPGIVARIKILSNLKLDEHRLPQDGRFKIQTNEYKISFRVSILPVFDGEKVVMRLLDETSRGLTLELIGFLGRDLEVMHRLIRKSNGIILVTGPTGSGKTTTLYTIMDILNSSDVNISTVEDPVEYRMQRINQTQVNAKIGMTFATALRSLLRQDPDIIMVGEIRDQETMEIALHAAMTGHLVLSTLHTNSAAATIPRLVDMGAEPFLVASTVNGILAQRLVRKLCPDCRKERFLSEKEVRAMKKSLHMDDILKYLQETLENPKGKTQTWKNIAFFSPQGCERCGGTGFKGRMSIFETLEMSESIRKAISERATAEKIQEISRKEGMHSMLEDGLLKAARGITSIEEILRVVQE